MDEASARLRHAFCDAVPGYVSGLLTDRHWEVPGIDAAIDEAAAWLADGLDELLALPYREQRRSPLELFQEAMRPVGDALAAAGVTPPDRDEVTVGALPGDVYALAPASSQDLGEEAWEAHIAWGLSKAQAMRRPTVAYVGRNLMDRTRIESVAASAGYELEGWEPGSGAPLIALVDLTAHTADDAIRELASLGVRVIAFGPHVDDIAMARAGALGAADVLPRSRFFARLADQFPAVT